MVDGYNEEMTSYYTIRGYEDVNNFSEEDFINIFCYVDEKSIPDNVVQAMLLSLGSRYSPLAQSSFFKKWGGVCSLPNRKSRVYSVQREVKGVF